MPLDVQLSDGVAHQALDDRHGTLPAVADLLGAREPAAVEREVLGHQIVGQQKRAGLDQPPPQPGLPVLECLSRPRRRERRQVIRLAHNQFRDAVRCGAERGDPSGPVESGRFFGQVGERAQVVGEVGVATLDDVPVRGCKLGLERDDPGRRRSVVARTVDKAEHRRDVLGIGGEDLGMLLIAVVGLVGQSEPGLAQVHQVAGGVLGVGVDVNARAAADAGALQRPQYRGQRLGGRRHRRWWPVRPAVAAHLVRPPSARP